LHFVGEVNLQNYIPQTKLTKYRRARITEEKTNIMGSIKRRKAVDKRTYKSKTPQKPTSYDTSRPETDTPQEIRENLEPEGIYKRQEDGK